MKTSEQEIVEAVADRLHAYIGRGVRIDPFIDDIDPNLRVGDLERLLRIHFILTTDGAEGPGVIDFIRRLPNRLRRLKTTTSYRTVERDGEVRGKIDWRRTVELQARGGQQGSRRFACRETRENYGIDENLVLKTLLERIHTILFEDLEWAMVEPASYRWLQPWNDSTERLGEVFDRVYQQNVYLERVDVDEAVTDRMLRSVGQSRMPLYAEAAQLLERYRRLMSRRFGADEARSLLQNTFVLPERVERLFELYWVFRLLDSYDEVTMNLLDGQGDAVATWRTQAGSRYVLYHDSTGSDALRFSEQLDDVDPPRSDGYLARSLKVAERWRETAPELLGIGGGNSLWGGRPDILIERYGDGSAKPEEVFVGEVKYTRDLSYAAQGLRELLEYMAYIRDGDEYMEQSEELFSGTRITGGLFVDEHPATPRQDGPIGIYGFGDGVPSPL